MPDYTHVTYMKITAETYPLAVAAIAAPAFARIPFREVKNHVLVIQTDVSFATSKNPVQTETRASWCTRKMFKDIFKADMKKNPERFVQL